ncbi:MAG TPA: ABC transporter permease [Streptosporangiaceae bacterium]|nr:ABC transporter permease [Streptosporangiaceae bacterium]
MSNDRRLSAPGQLAAGDDITPGGLATAGLPDEPLAEFAASHGLRPAAERPPIGRYLQNLWQRRHFIMAFATARNIAMYTEARLGQLWQVLTPLLNAGVYFLVFGLLLKINRGIPNYLGFLVTGVFVFNFTQRAFITTSTVITDSLPLIRALRFPRAALPLAYVMIELEQMVLSMVVLAVILVLTGEPITWYWLLAIPALLLQTTFNIGVGLATARLGSNVNDFSQLLPFLMRTWLYVSGVLFNISTLAIKKEYIAILQINPVAIYITLIREAMLKTQRLSQPGAKPYNAHLCHLWATAGHKVGASQTLQMDSAYCHTVTNPAHYWTYGIAWALLALVFGFFFFWRAEAKYGRG